MSVVVINRRQFLVGASGAMLALPMLPSLLPAKARAQATKALPRFVCIASSHGCVREENMYPDDAILTDRQKLFDDHEVSRGDLKLNVNNGRASLAPVLEASSQQLTPALAAKMNVIRGLDLPWNIGHHTGGHLGNFARNDTNKIGDKMRPTVDQLLAYSPTFYANMGSIKKRSMHVGQDGNLAVSWGWSNPSGRNGSIQPIPTSYSSKDLFDSIFVQPAAPSSPQSSRTPVVDRVYAAYKSLHDGAFGDARRLSAADKRRLEEHMGRIAELQQRVTAGAATAAQCGERVPSQTVDKSSGGLRDMVIRQPQSKEFYQTFNDVIVAAFMCGTSRIATVYPLGFSPYAGDWHQEIAHTAQRNDGTQDTLMKENRNLFEQLFVDLIAKLDVEEGNGKTYLDNSLVMWSQESGPSTHDPIGLPIIAAGGAAGFLRTGNYVDLRRKIRSSMWTDFYTGVLYNQWLGTVLQSMGVPRNEFETNGNRGYGEYYTENVYGDPSSLWPDRLKGIASDIIPFLKA